MRYSLVMIGYSLLQTGMKTNEYVRTSECESECIHTNDNTNTHTHTCTHLQYMIERHCDAIIKGE